jgi:hypothetical protein
MKTKVTVICAVVLCMSRMSAPAQRTEVSVKEGKVIAETATTTVEIDAGKKGVLVPDNKPVVTVDNPLVDDVMKMLKLVEAEQELGEERIDSVFVMAGKADKDRIVGALYFEYPNKSDETMETLKFGYMSLIPGLEIYDLNGNLLKVDIKPSSPGGAAYTIHLREKVEPGESIKVIAFADVDEMPLFPGGAPGVWQEGPLWHFRTANMERNCLNYYRFTLPKSAILVDSNRKTVSSESVDGRLVLTIRNYTGKHGDGMCKISFLWPDEDRTSLADIPDEYHGIKGLVVDSVRIGTLEDELAHGLLCVNSQSFFFKNKEGRHCVKGWMSYDMKVLPYEPMVLSCLYWGSDAGTRVFDISVDGVKIATQTLQNNKPGEFFEVKYELPLELTGHKEKVTVKFEAHPDCWVGSVFGLQMLKASEAPKELEPLSDLAEVRYNGLSPGEFMTRWAFLGPMPIHGVAYPPEEENQLKAFDEEAFDPGSFEPRVKIGDEEYEWMALRSRKGIIEPPRPANRLYYVYGYALAQVDMPRETNAVLGIGSDDAVKVWLNGKLVHRHWINRGVTVDNDLVPVTFKKGKNQLVIKILNGAMGWGFSCRVVRMDSEPLLNKATYRGLQPGEYMKKWLLAGPVPVTLAGPDPTDYETKKRGFDIDAFSLGRFEPKVHVAGVDYEWAAHRSSGANVDLVQALGRIDYAFAYAWAQIDMAEEVSGILSLGYDDIIKVWLNDQVIHEHWGLAAQDSDRIPVTFKKGKNQLVVKVLNEVGPWEFSCRLLESGENP